MNRKNDFHDFDTMWERYNRDAMRNDLLDRLWRLWPYAALGALGAVLGLLVGLLIRGAW